ncbi:Sec-independent protein translocase protein TatB [Neptunicoccus cionae]|uniref:Sec-independent protein translocase protein TatB n=1 Tax=Neptunicoccus cionae TaxID=2035344 RepID=UPI000C77D005|nr:Sec-independent protein translocase protein TatB [Amylibacter cionae]PLS22089.1 twin-arginine translocase subunit TatB [Amylibacter cionae]
MFDIGMAEMIVIGVVALIVVGPKDLPQMFRKVGQFVGKARGMARDFQRAMEQAADGTGVNEIASDLKSVTSMKNLGLDDATKSFQDYQKNFEPEKVDAAAEKARREAAVAEANKAATKWPPESAPEVENSEVVGEPVQSAAPAKVKAPAKKAPAKKPAAKKPAAKKPAAPKKTAAKKPAAKSTTAAKAPAKSAAAKSGTAKANATKTTAAAKKTASKTTSKAAGTKS